MKTPPPSSAWSKGFTLLEILVALAVFAILLALFFQIFTGAQSAVSVNTSRLDGLRRAQFFFDRLGADLQNRAKRTDLPDGIQGFNCVKQSGNDALGIIARVEGYNGPRRLAVLRYQPDSATQAMQRGAYGTDWNGTRPVPFKPLTIPTPVNPGEYELLDSGIFRCELQFIDKSGRYLDALPLNPEDAVAVVVTIVLVENPEVKRIQDRLPGLVPQFRDSNGQRLLPQWQADLSSALSYGQNQDIPPRSIRIYESVVLL